MKKIRWVVVVVIVLAIVYGFVGNYFYNFALNAHTQKKFMQGNKHLKKSEATAATVHASKEADAIFLGEHPAKNVSISSFDRLKLAGYVYENMNQHKWAIIAHGYNANASYMTKYARHYYEQGYNVLTPDLRGHGKSEGNYIGMGWDDRKDMLQWIEYVVKRDPQASIALHGISMGGATVMMTSGEKLPSQVKVIVEDCGYASVVEEFTYQLKDLFSLPKFPVLNAANTVTEIRAGYDLNDASAVKQVAKSKTPMLFIHGDADKFVPYYMLDEVYNAAPVEKEKLIVHGAGHAESEQMEPEKYWGAVLSFVGKYVK